MGQKTDSEYRRMVRARAFHRASKTIGGKGRLFGIIVAIFASVLLQPPASLPDLLQVNAVMTGLFILIIFIFVLLWRISRESVIIYNEQQVSKEELEQENNNLKDRTKPKLELSYEDSESASYQNWGKNLTDIRITVKNVGGTQVKNVTVKIKKTVPDTLPFFPVILSIMHDEPDFINPSSSCFANVLETNPEGGFLLFCAKDKPLQYHYPIQDYEILISASGDNSTLTEKWFRFSLNPPGSERAYEFEELAHNQAETKQTDQEPAE